MGMITNPDTINMYKLARIVYAETYGCSLRAVESLASMISNHLHARNRQIKDIINDSEMFESLNKSSAHHWALSVDANNRGFKMCLRTIVRMIHGDIPDLCFGATCFHRDEQLPDWAVARGYIADIDGLLFYL